MKSCIKFCGDHQHINQNIHPSPSKWKMIKDNHNLKAKPLTAFVYSISKGAKICQYFFILFNCRLISKILYHSRFTCMQTPSSPFVAFEQSFFNKPIYGF